VRTGAWVVGLAALLVAVVTASASVGSVAIPPREVVAVALSGLPGVASDAPTAHRTIVLSVRLPRVTLAAAVGVGLAAAGTVMQGFFRNPMADPSVVGVSSGAAVGAVAVIVLGVQVPYGLPAAAFAGALLAAFGVYLLATERGHTPVATLLLAGIAVQTFLGAVVSFMLVHAGEAIREAVYWMMGHLHDATWGKVRLVVAVVVPCVLVLLPYARDLNAMLLGETDARAVGVEVERTKRVLLAVASVATAASVAAAGVIGFVGLVVPHVMRLLVGPDHRVLLPTSALAGGVFLVAADTLARTVGGGVALPVGIVTAAVGAPFFLYLLRTREVHAT
jgi:iron complex transport system permease protein